MNDSVHTTEQLAGLAEATAALDNAVPERPMPVEFVRGGAADTPNDLDNLLNQFDASTAQPQQEGLSDIETAARLENAQAYRQREQLAAERAEFDQQKFIDAHNRDLKATISEIRGQHDFPDEFVTAWLDAKARGNEGLQAAWLNRANDPGTLKRMVNMLARDFNKMATRMPDPELTEERAAITDAIMRGASNKQPAEAPPNFNSMSNSEYRKYVRENFGYDAGI